MDTGFDEIPRRRRRNMFTVAAWFNGSVATFFIIMYLTCMRSWRADSERKWNDRFNDMKVRAEKDAEIKVRPAVQIMDRLNDETQQKIDSLQHRLDSLNSRKNTGT